MLTVELVRNKKPTISFQVDPKGGIKMAGKHVGGLDELHKIGLLSELNDAVIPCPRTRFLNTSERYLQE